MFSAIFKMEDSKDELRCVPPVKPFRLQQVAQGRYFTIALGQVFALWWRNIRCYYCNPHPDNQDLISASTVTRKSIREHNQGHTFKSGGRRNVPRDFYHS